MEREIIKPIGFEFEDHHPEDKNWEKIDDPKIIETLKEASATLKAISILNKPTS